MVKNMITFLLLISFLISTVLSQAIPDVVGDINVGRTANKHYFGFAPVGTEFNVREPSQCQGAAFWEASWDSGQNFVDIQLQFFGLPYKPSFCYDYNPTTAYNQWPSCVTDGRWQGWLAGPLVNIVWFYDSNGILIGNEYDIKGRHGLPPGTINVTIPTLQTVGTQVFWESDPATLFASVQLSFAYDQILDDLGLGGFLVSPVPVNLSEPTILKNVYTNVATLLKPIPVLSWADFMDQIINGGFVAVATSVSPNPKPSYLAGRDNIMIGWNSLWTANPNNAFAQAGLNPISNGKSCGSFQIPFPGHFPF